jgi:hypothetical protein
MIKQNTWKICTLAILLYAASLNAQNVAINTSGNSAYVSAILDLSNNNIVGSVGFLPPYVTLPASGFGLSGTASQSNGLLVYNTGGPLSAGLYYWNNTTATWIPMGGGGGSVTAANDGTSLNGTTVVLGGAYNSLLGELTQNTEIPLNGYNLTFSSGGAGMGNIGIDLPVNSSAAQALEIAGATNTVRIDGLGTSGTIYNQVTANTGNLVFANNTNGDLWSLPAPAAASILTSSSTGVLAWQNGTVPTGSGTLNYLARWTPSGAVLGIGITQDNGTRVGIQTTVYAFTVGNLLQVTANATDASAILGTTAQATGYGVQGTNTAGSGTTAGVYGSSTSAAGYGVEGIDNTTGGIGVLGSSSGGGSTGVYGYIGTFPGSGISAGVYASNNTTSIGDQALFAYASGTSSSKSGIYAQNKCTGAGAQYGVQSLVWGNTGTGTGYGFYGAATGTGTTNVGGYFSSSGATNNYGVLVPSAGGNSGFGTITPTTLVQLGNSTTTTGKFSVYSQDFQYGQIQIGNPSSNAEASMQFISGVTAFGDAATSTNGTTNLWNIGAGTYALGGNKFIVSVVSAGPIMTFTSAGIVGIGQTSPNRELEIGGVANTERIDGLGSAGTTFNQVASNKSDLVYANDANGDLWSLPAPAAASILVSSSTGTLSWTTGTPAVGSGTLNYLARWTPNGSTLGIGVTEDNGVTTAINTTATAPVASQMLTVTGNSTATLAIVGITSTASGIGVQGYNTQTSGTSLGVEGYIGALSAPPSPAGVYGGTQTASTYAVLGKNTATGITIGVGGFGSNYVPAMPGNGAGGMFASNNVGAWGTYNTTAYYGMGVQGVGYLGSNTVYNYDWGMSGNIGSTNHSGDAGIFGYYGALIAVPNTPSGVMGVSNVAANNGVYGYNVTGNAASSGCGVVGYTQQTAGFGVLGGNTTSPGVGIFGYGGGSAGSYYQNGEGVMGDGTTMGTIGLANGGTPYAGVWGVTSSNANYFTNNEGVMGSGVYGVMGYGTSYGGFFENTSGWYTYVAGGGYKVLGNGSVSTEVMDEQKQPRVLTCPEAPEVLFEDFGNAKLTNGKIHVDLDKLYANNVTINEKHPLRVIITLNDNCNGVYVTNRTTTGFDVVELNNGTSNASFTYEVIANRAALYNDKNELMRNFADERFAVGPGPIKATSADKDLKKVSSDNGVQKADGEKQNLKK